MRVTSLPRAFPALFPRHNAGFSQPKTRADLTIPFLITLAREPQEFRARFASTSSSESPSRSTTSGALRTRGWGTGGPRFRTAGGFGGGAGGRKAGFRASHKSQHGPAVRDGPGSFPKWPTSCRLRHPSFIPQYRAISSKRSKSRCNFGPRRFFRPNPLSNFWTLPTSWSL